MKRVTRYIFALVAAVSMFVATASVANACLSFFYQPEVPESLREE